MPNFAAHILSNDSCRTIEWDFGCNPWSGPEGRTMGVGRGQKVFQNKVM